MATQLTKLKDFQFACVDLPNKKLSYNKENRGLLLVRDIFQLIFLKLFTYHHNAAECMQNPASETFPADHSKST